MNARAVVHAANAMADPAASAKMKITKKQLKRIIREERTKLIRESKRRKLREQEEMAPEAAPSGKKPPIGQAKTRTVMQSGEKIWFALSSLVDQAMDQSDPASWRELADDLRGLADDVEDSIPEDV